MPLAVRLACFAGTFSAALLAMFMLDQAPFVQKMPTAVAALALFCSLPMVDSSLLGRSVHPALGGVLLGWSVGFFLRQSETSAELAPGAGRVVALAFIVSLGLVAFRWYRGRQPRV